jgi:hypothetical protein
MKRFHYAVVAGSVLTSAADDASGVVSRLYNHAGLNDCILRAGQRPTMLILGESDVGAKWIHCPVWPQQSGRMPGWAKALAALDAVLNLLPWAMARNARQSGETLGSAVQTAAASIGCFRPK